MIKNTLESLLKIANKLDYNGFSKEADLLDSIIIKMSKEKDSCPKATQDLDLNLKNRQKAIDKYIYGPKNPGLDNKKTSPNNDAFWEKIAKVWSKKHDVEDVKEAKTMRCGNCAAFDTSKEMLSCISNGIKGGDKGEDAVSVIESGKLGYCHFLDFKCAAKRTCKAWVAKDKS